MAEVTDDSLNQTTDIPKEEANNKSNKSDSSKELYNIGSTLFTWINNRNLVEIYHPHGDIKSPKKGKYAKYITYVRCVFDIKELPLHIALPMVCPPLELNGGIADPNG